MSLDMIRIMSLFFSPGQDLEKNPNTWYDQTLCTIGFMR